MFTEEKNVVRHANEGRVSACRIGVHALILLQKICLFFPTKTNVYIKLCVCMERPCASSGFSPMASTVRFVRGWSERTFVCVFIICFAVNPPCLSNYSKTMDKRTCWHFSCAMQHPCSTKTLPFYHEVAVTRVVAVVVDIRIDWIHF